MNQQNNNQTSTNENIASPYSLPVNEHPDCNKPYQKDTQNLVSCILIAVPSIISFIFCAVFDSLPALSGAVAIFYENNANTYISLKSIIDYLIFLIFTIICSLSCSEKNKKISFILSIICGDSISNIVPAILNAIIVNLIANAYINAELYSIVTLLGNIVRIIISITVSTLLFLLLQKINKKENQADNITYDTTPIEVYNANGENFQLNQNINTKSSRSRATTAVLCFFLGTFGVHRLYAGKIGTGLLWMFTAGLFGVGSFIDFIIIICGGFKDSEGKTI